MTIEKNDAKLIIDHVFSSTTITDQHVAALNLVKKIKEVSPETLKSICDDYKKKRLPNDQIFSLLFYLYDLSGDLFFLEKINQQSKNIKRIQDLNEIFWNIGRRLFTKPQEHYDNTPLRKTFSKITKNISSLTSPQRKKIKSVKKIGILSPQILGIRHSPTREAFSIALHLAEQHGCDVTIYNTNNMNYTNNLSIINPFIANHNPELHGEQEITISYLGFIDKKIKINSFSPSTISTGKNQEIIEAITANETDAIISHGENFATQECIYKRIPSIFVTTGGTVPFAHSDAYWVPKKLFTEEKEIFAEKFGHYNFLQESMMVTPEGKSEKPTPRENFGLIESNFIYLVAGTRLAEEIDFNFSTACQKIIEQASNAIIIFAGTNGLDLAKFFESKLISDRKVINIGFQNDLASICAMSNVYLNPFRQGGGTSSQTAILNDTPVVTMNHGHISSIVPSSRIQNSWQEYIEYSTKLANNKDFFQKEINLFSNHFNENLQTEKQISKILNHLTKISKDYS